MYLTWLDSNSWLIELAGQRILLDPWLVGPLTFGNLTWLFKSERRTPRAIPEAIDLILLSQGLPDHAHIPTLEALDRSIPVVGSPGAAKVAQSLGYQQITTLQHEQVFTGEGFTIQATPGSPVGPQTIENGYILRESASGQSLYYEPHGYHPPLLKTVEPIDVVITPLIDLSLPLLGPVIKGSQTALQVAEWLRPQVILPTAAGGDITFEGILMSILKAEGDLTALQQKLKDAQLPTQVFEPSPWERFELKLSDRPAPSLKA